MEHVAPRDVLTNEAIGTASVEVDDTPFVHPFGFSNKPCNCLGCAVDRDRAAFYALGDKPLPIYNGCTKEGPSFMEPVAEFIRNWFAKLFLMAVEGCIFACAFKALGV